MSDVAKETLDSVSKRDGSSVERRCLQPADVGRPLAASRPFNGAVMADSTEPTEISSKVANDATTGLEGCGPKNDDQSEPTGLACAERSLEALGSIKGTTTAAVHPQESANFDLRRLRPVELTRLLNSTDLGAVISERQLYRHRSKAGFRIGDGRRVDLLRYASWLMEERNRRAERRTISEVAAERGKKPTGKSVKPELGRLRAVDVMALVDSQNYRCALTHRALKPEEAALDHIIPVSKGGRHTIANAQVLHKDVNRAKGVMTNQEFITMCREVVACADSLHSKRSSNK